MSQKQRETSAIPAGARADARALAGAVLFWAAVLLFALGSFAVPLRAAELKFPELTGRIVDEANLIKPEDRAAIEADLKDLEAKATDQVVVVTLPSLQGVEIEDFGYQLGRKWGIGRAGKNNGGLLIVAPNERKVRIEVGRGLEPILTDLMSRIIIENAIVPEFKAGRFSSGIRAGVRDIKDTLLGDAEAVKERAKGLEPPEDAGWLPLVFIAFWIAIVLYIMWTQYRYARQLDATPGAVRRTQRYGRPGVIVLPSGSDSSWSSGSSGGWSSGDSGGGFSGGGGDFGGGGSSGSW